MAADPRTLPDPFPVTPLAAPPEALIRVPGGRSITNRALVAAALADGTSEIQGAGLSDDTEAMIDCLRELGVEIDVVPIAGAVDIHVVGVAGHPRGPAQVFTRLSGTTSRFITPVAALAGAPVHIDADEPMRARPMADLFAALRSLGVEVEEHGEPGHLPVTVTGPPSGTLVEVTGTVSSQFISGLLLMGGAKPDGLDIKRTTERLVSGPYVGMTTNVMSAFGVTVRSDPFETIGIAPEHGGRFPTYRPATYRVEPDAATAGYFLAAAVITGGRVTVPGLPSAALQADAALLEIFTAMGATVTHAGGDVIVHGPPLETDGRVRLRGGTFDLTAFSDMAPTVAALAAFAVQRVEVTGVGFIRGKESDRIAASVTELQRCGVEARQTDDGFVVWPDGRPADAEPHGAVIHTYDDHRMAMSFALLGLVIPGIEITDPGCVAKTHPGFFADLDRLRS